MKNNIVLETIQNLNEMFSLNLEYSYENYIIISET